MFNGPNKVSTLSAEAPLNKNPERALDFSGDLFKNIGILLENQKKDQNDSDELLFSPFLESESEKTIPGLGRASQTSISSNPDKKARLKIRPNLSLASTDVENDPLKGLEFQTYNSSTTYSGSYQDSDRKEFISPTNSRMWSDNSEKVFKFSEHKIGSINPMSPLSFPQQIGFCSDRSNFSWNENTQTKSAMSTPTGSHQQFFIQHQSVPNGQKFSVLPQNMKNCFNFTEQERFTKN